MPARMGWIIDISEHRVSTATGRAYAVPLCFPVRSHAGAIDP
jgi:hypothetical protein